MKRKTTALALILLVNGATGGELGVGITSQDPMPASDTTDEQSLVAGTENNMWSELLALFGFEETSDE